MSRMWALFSSASWLYLMTLATAAEDGRLGLWQLLFRYNIDTALCSVRAPPPGRGRCLPCRTDAGGATEPSPAAPHLPAAPAVPATPARGTRRPV